MRTGCDICDEIFKVTEKINEENLDLSIRNIEDLVYELKDAGQDMEDRLREYREAIEGLGFVRR